MSSPDSHSSSPDKNVPKKPYRSPIVEVYGTIREITKNVGATGKNDSMSSNSTKTGV